VNKKRKNRLRRFEHVMRRKKTNAVRVVMKMIIEGIRERKRPKKDSWI
jgi:hypothetical protein